jgi:putative oxidoreductase
VHVLIAGRILLGAPFVLAGLNHLRILGPLTSVLRGRGVHQPRAVLLAGTCLQIAAGACLTLGIYIVVAAASLIVFTAAASVVFFNFWDQTGQSRSDSLNAWFNNLGWIGGLLVAIGALSGSN